jgi:hypothetical protein
VIDFSSRSASPNISIRDMRRYNPLRGIPMLQSDMKTSIVDCKGIGSTDVKKKTSCCWCKGKGVDVDYLD